MSILSIVVGNAHAACLAIIKADPAILIDVLAKIVISQYEKEKGRSWNHTNSRILEPEILTNAILVTDLKIRLVVIHEPFL